MPYVGQTFRVHYIAKGFRTGLTDVTMVVYKPDGSKQGVYTLSEVNLGDGKGIYYYDYVDSDIAGTYLFVINSLSHPKKDAKQVYFDSSDVLVDWNDDEKKQIRHALGIDGTKTTSSGGLLQTISTALTLVSGNVEFIKDIEGGRWDFDGNEMVFYKDDNITEVARFEILDINGLPDIENPVQRVRI